MAEKEVYLHRADTDKEWRGISPPPQANEIIIVLGDGEEPDRIKIGDGVTNYANLPFYDMAASEDLGNLLIAVKDKGHIYRDTAKIKPDAGLNAFVTGDRAIVYGATGINAQGHSDREVDSLWVAYSSNVGELYEEWERNWRNKQNGVGTNNKCFSFAAGDYAVTEGLDTVAWSGDGDAAHAEGKRSVARGQSAHAEGTDTKALNNNSHAEGQNTKATGNVSHAEGYYTVADGDHSHAEGYNTWAAKATSHAEGSQTQTQAAYSHAEGYGTVAASECQHVQGKLNLVDDKNKYAHIIGGGTSVLYTKAEAAAEKTEAQREGREVNFRQGDLNYEKCTRANIHTVKWNGEAWYKGDILTDGAVKAKTGEFDTEIKTNKIILNGTNLSNELEKYKGINTQVGVLAWDTTLNDPREGGVKMLGGSQSYRYGLACGYKSKVLGAHGMAFGSYLNAKGGQTAVATCNNSNETINGSTALFMVGNGYARSEDDQERRNAFLVTADGSAKVSKDLIVGENLKVNSSISLGGVTLTTAQLSKLLKLVEKFDAEEVYI